MSFWMRILYLTHPMMQCILARNILISATLCHRAYRELLKWEIVWTNAYANLRYNWFRYNCNVETERLTETNYNPSLFLFENSISFWLKLTSVNSCLIMLANYMLVAFIVNLFHWTTTEKKPEFIIMQNDFCCRRMTQKWACWACRYSHHFTVWFTFKPHLCSVQVAESLVVHQLVN